MTFRERPNVLRLKYSGKTNDFFKKDRIYFLQFFIEDNDRVSICRCNHKGYIEYDSLYDALVNFSRLDKSQDLFEYGDNWTDDFITLYNKTITMGRRELMINRLLELEESF